MEDALATQIQSVAEALFGLCDCVPPDCLSFGHCGECAKARPCLTDEQLDRVAAVVSELAEECRVYLVADATRHAPTLSPAEAAAVGEALAEFD